MRTNIKVMERRAKTRFPMRRELRYKLLEGATIVASGSGETINISSGGIAFQIDRHLNPGGFMELSISWPVLLDENCPMRLVVFGRVVRSAERFCVCRVDKYEFRTQARKLQTTTEFSRSDGMLQRWADGFRRDNLKARAMI